VAGEKQSRTEKMNKEKLQSILDNYNSLESKLRDPAILSNQQEITRIAKEKNEISELAGLIRSYFTTEKNLEESQELLDSGDQEIAEIAEEEIKQLKEEKNNLPGNQRIVEVDPGKFRKLERLRD